ncbi:pyridoxamine kinase [Carnobacteriaceae bacterium zg-ZUI78]|nr:pyridoxamine kinase [Carnobacteriaceae bacterium zg-ZUI78]
MKQLLVVNDLSCLGKVAISVTLPILATTQIETHLLPTVLLSAHTGFPNVYKHILTSDLEDILHHWKENIDLTFDAILTGYFGHKEQVKLFLDHLPDTDLLIVDPVMADNGKLYSGFPHDYPMVLKSLCDKADIILPNLTEACLLLNKPIPDQYTQEDILNILHALSNEKTQTVILTGISYEQGKIGVAYLHHGVYGYCDTKYIPHYFSGTGDICSALISSLLIQHIPIHQAVQTTLDFIIACLDDTLSSKKNTLYGIVFEKQLPNLSKHIQLLKGYSHEK